jgi:hypothetical protein
LEFDTDGIGPPQWGRGFEVNAVFDLPRTRFTYPDKVA